MPTIGLVVPDADQEVAAFGVEKGRDGLQYGVGDDLSSLRSSCRFQRKWT